jgi:hypothetical protein
MPIPKYSVIKLSFMVKVQLINSLPSFDFVVATRIAIHLFPKQFASERVTVLQNNKINAEKPEILLRTHKFVILTKENISKLLNNRDASFLSTTK